MLPYALNKIDAATFQQICDQRFSESSTIDFKADLARNDEKGKVELCKDVCAMANADGGDLVYGIAEGGESGTADQISPVRGETVDDALRRILQTLESNVEPRIKGVLLHPVPLVEGFGLVIRVPASFDGPHCIRNSNSQRRFVVRNGTITSDMTFEQIKVAFSGTAALASRAREFTQSRFALVEAQKRYMSFPDMPQAAVIVVPIGGLAGRIAIDIKKVQFVDLIAWDGGANQRIDFDGIGAYSGTPSEIYSQGHFFRNGAMEFLTHVGSKNESGQLGVWGPHTLMFFKRALQSAVDVAKRYQISGPAIVTCGLFHVQGSDLDTGRHMFLRHARLVDRQAMVFPEIFLEDIAGEIDVVAVLHDTADVLYQAYGFNEAPKPS